MKIPHLKVFSFLDHESLLNCLSVCKLWYETLEEDLFIQTHLWRELFLKYHPAHQDLVNELKGPQNFKLLFFEAAIKDNISSRCRRLLDIDQVLFPNMVLNSIIFYENLIMTAFPYISPEKYQLYCENIKPFWQPIFGDEKHAILKWIASRSYADSTENEKIKLLLQYIEPEIYSILFDLLQRNFVTILLRKENEAIIQFISRVSTVYPVMKSKLTSMCHEFDKEGEKFENHYVNVLTGSKWLYDTPSCVMDYNIAEFIQNYQQEYQRLHANRKLLWQYQFGDAVLKLNHFDKPMEVRCSTYQMSILLVFNGKGEKVIIIF